MKKRVLIIFALAIILLVIAYQLRIPHILLGKYLSPSSNLTKADAIVVVSGDNDRMKHAIDLYKQGYAPKLVLSGAQKEGPASDALVMRLEASAAGIPNEAVIMEEKANNTYENALYTKEIILNQQINSLILVSSPYHQRRVYETFKNVFKDTSIGLQNSPSPYAKWKFNNWWKSERESHLTQEETLKVLWANISGNYK